jgi:hypothetical protein
MHFLPLHSIPVSWVYINHLNDAMQGRTAGSVTLKILWRLYQPQRQLEGRASGGAAMVDLCATIMNTMITFLRSPSFVPYQPDVSPSERDDRLAI